MRPSYDDKYMVAQSMAANVTGRAVATLASEGLSFQAVWTGTPTGTLKLQVSNDNTTYTDLPGTSQATGGAAGNFLWNLAGIYFQFIRLVYVRTGGVGTLDANSYSKENS